ncbi:MAG: ABC transporter substrate-binding protein [Acidimicrobiales bacterium]|nr:ABC transporter substrate-binding protein [Acidimicrobiales bacterium]MXX42883.1 ABC transporter substrate-binding protein [Acidimicrobiales bacterium]MYB82675.1 ABC transporter substrate-binding protein [Acidimicrobiales bacterium]MYD34853.1 ABC transporter substrate-binding protein [Acidimicrobiales bacterium]MYI08825.1 ABC transporter substrate-binding protein [Acidimicrobiales bacterium]
MSRVAGLLVTLLLAAGCSESPPEASPPVPPQLAPADGYDAGVFTLGVLVDLSGPAAEADRAALAGAQAYWSGVDARGGIAGLYPVELSVQHLDADALGEWDVAALTYVSSAIDAADVTAELPLPVVPAVATLGGENLDWVLTSAAPVELTTVALLDRFRASGPGATWCVIVDGSPLGRQVAAAAYAAGAARETVPAMLDLDVGEIEVLDMDASVFDVTDAVSDRQCRYVLVEAAEPGAIHVLERLPPNLTVARRSTLAAGIELPGHVELLIDPAPPWQTGRSAVMDAFAADWARFHADSAPDPRVRAGWLSQLRLHLLLEQAVAAGDVSRERLVALAGQVEPVDPDRNTLPGVPRIGMDISEPIGGGPLRTLRLYGRTDVAADELGLRQVLALDVTHLMEALRDRLSDVG